MLLHLYPGHPLAQGNLRLLMVLLTSRREGLHPERLDSKLPTEQDDQLEFSFRKEPRETHIQPQLAFVRSWLVLRNDETVPCRRTRGQMLQFSGTLLGTFADSNLGQAEQTQEWRHYRRNFSCGGWTRNWSQPRGRIRHRGKHLSIPVPLHCANFHILLFRSSHSILPRPPSLLGSSPFCLPLLTHSSGSKLCCTASFLMIIPCIS